eukprot:TRINITY_DN9558_c0_g2_i1.p1 TRINITY_DN9558_c0_g2~~TRINITY_DN9558_c0_g2_i1.p1  ORF type:complete len:119 (+),score=7.46 TRINITY_DN9558_c0_g2_i1:355-711(+)
MTRCPSNSSFCESPSSTNPAKLRLEPSPNPALKVGSSNLFIKQKPTRPEKDSTTATELSQIIPPIRRFSKALPSKFNMNLPGGRDQIGLIWCTTVEGKAIVLHFEITAYIGKSSNWGR